MIISPWLIYFADLADDIGNLLAVIGILCLMSVAFCLFINGMSYMDCDIYNKEFKFKPYVIKPCLITGIVLLVINSFLPSTRTIYKMIAVPAVINSSVVQKLPDELQQFIDKELKVDEVKK